MSRSREGQRAANRPVGALARACLKAPVQLYRYTVRPWLGWRCRHLPTCSDYALEAIDLNGAWRGFWLMVSRLLRCHPFGTAGYDPVPDIRRERYIWMPWKYGRWTGSHIEVDWKIVDQPGKDRTQEPDRPAS